MNERLLTLDNLYEYYSTHKKSCHFNASDDEKAIIVQTPATLKFKKDEITEGLTAVTLQACHTDKNLNSSSISQEVMENKFLPTFKNRPILGYIHTVNGQDEFYDHRMHEEDNELVYDEIAIGVIPESNNARLEYDEKAEHYNVFVDGYIFNDYTKAKDIIEREEECAVSVELSLKSFSYDAKEKTLVIEDGFFSGITVLGKNPDGSEVKPGMANSNIKLKDFSLENNSFFSDVEESELVKTLNKLNETLSKINIQASANENLEEGGTEVENEIILNEEVTTEETETVTITEEETPVVETESVDEVTEDTTTEETVITEEEFSEDTTEVTPVEEENVSTEPETYEVEYSAKCGETIKTYSVSLNDKIYALQQLVNDTYCEDGDWYSVEVFEDSKTVQFYGWMKSYRQSYKVKSDVYSLVGDRIEIHSVWMSDEEEEKFNNMKSNYSSIEAELNQYHAAEAYADKLTVFDDESYAQFLETDDFKTLMSDETINANTKEQLHDMAELTFAKLVKAQGSFAMSEPESKPEKKPNMFAFAKNETTTSFLDGLLNK